MTRQIKKTNKSIMEMNSEEAKSFLFESDSYCNADMPAYFNFSKMLIEIDKTIKDRELKDLCRADVNKKSKKICPSKMEDVSYKLLTNKTCNYSWRQFQLIHPVLYVFLVNDITREEHWGKIINRFKEFSKEKIKCMSYPRKSMDKQNDKILVARSRTRIN